MFKYEKGWVMLNSSRQMWTNLYMIILYGEDYAWNNQREASLTLDLSGSILPFNGDESGGAHHAPVRFLLPRFLHHGRSCDGLLWDVTLVRRDPWRHGS